MTNYRLVTSIICHLIFPSYDLLKAFFTEQARTSFQPFNSVIENGYCNVVASGFSAHLKIVLKIVENHALISWIVKITKNDKDSSTNGVLNNRLFSAFVTNIAIVSY